MNGLLIEIALAVVVLSLAILFGLAFHSAERTRTSVQRLRERAPAFRGGMLCIVVGVIGVMEADALRAFAGLSSDHAFYVALLSAGYLLAIMGVGVLDAILWRKPAPGRT